MIGIMDAVTALEQKAAGLYHINEGDYLKDGLLYCGICHTPKQYRGVLLDMPRVVPCMCRCKQAEAEAKARFREAEQLEQRIRLYRRTGFAEAEMQRWTFDRDDGTNPRIMGAMRRYADNFAAFDQQGKGLLLYGGVGTGKTYAAACIVNALIDRGRPCLMTNFTRVLNTLWDTESKLGYIDSLNKFDLLVLDDLGAERRSEYAQEQVFNLIDARYRAKKPLIVTTNLTLEEITSPGSIGNSRIYDRLLEMCHPVKIEGASRRRQKLKADYKATNQLLGL